MLTDAMEEAAKRLSRTEGRCEWHSTVDYWYAECGHSPGKGDAITPPRNCPRCGKRVISISEPPARDGWRQDGDVDREIAFKQEPRTYGDVAGTYADTRGTFAAPSPPDGVSRLSERPLTQREYEYGEEVAKRLAPAPPEERGFEADLRGLATTPEAKAFAEKVIAAAPPDEPVEPETVTEAREVHAHDIMYVAMWVNDDSKAALRQYYRHIESLLAYADRLREERRQARDAILREGMAANAANARVARLTEALRSFLASYERAESNRGCFSCSEQHDCRCESLHKVPKRCTCGRVELDAAEEAACAALEAERKRGKRP